MIKTSGNSCGLRSIRERESSVNSLKHSLQQNTCFYELKNYQSDAYPMNMKKSHAGFRNGLAMYNALFICQWLADEYFLTKRNIYFIYSDNLLEEKGFSI
jgi:hypothetical protein